MSVKEFDKLFGLTSTIEEEKKRFVIRIENTAFTSLVLGKHNSEQYDWLFRRVCYQLGEDGLERIEKSSQVIDQIPPLSSLTNKDFYKTLRVIVALYYCLTDNQEREFLSQYVDSALEQSSVSLGVKWKDGVFYPAGDEFLDEALIDTSLDYLNQYPNEKKDLKMALDNYYSNSLYGVVENCFIAVEGISRQILKNTKTLDNNKEELLKSLHFSKYWDKIFVNYIHYAHEYRRHAGENRHDLKLEEVEGFLYITCILIRATIRNHEGKK